MRVLIIEDDLDLCVALDAVLKREGINADFCNDGALAIEYLSIIDYDMCCLDRLLPNKNGLDILSEMRVLGKQTPVLMLTALSSIRDKIDGLEAGADDYLAKPFDTNELIARIRALGRRRYKAIAPEIFQYNGVTLNPYELFMSCKGKTVKLSAKECDLLGVFISNPETLHTREDLFNKVWGVNSEADYSCMDSYICFVRRRLTTINANVVISTVRGVGYRMEKQND